MVCRVPGTFWKHTKEIMELSQKLVYSFLQIKWQILIQKDRLCYSSVWWEILSSGLKLSLDGWVNLRVAAFHHHLTKQFLQVTAHQCFHLGALKWVSSCLLRAGGPRDSPELGCWARGAWPRRLITFHLAWISGRILHVAVFPGKRLLGLYPLHLEEE